jgi:hypothetical protein
MAAARAIEGETLIEPRPIRYRRRTRRKVWDRNCISFGLSSGFVEPLESTSIHLFMIGATRLVQMFPFGGIEEAVVARYNELARNELERVRDFIILHYKATERDDSPFWRRCRDMDIPDTLAQRIALFRESALAYQASDDLFASIHGCRCCSASGSSREAITCSPACCPRRSCARRSPTSRQYRQGGAQMPQHQRSSTPIAVPQRPSRPDLTPALAGPKDRRVPEHAKTPRRATKAEQRRDDGADPRRGRISVLEARPSRRHAQGRRQARRRASHAAQLLFRRQEGAVRRGVRAPRGGHQRAAHEGARRL